MTKLSIWSLHCFNCMLQFQVVVFFLVQNNSCSISDFKSAKQVQKSLYRSISEHAKQDQNHSIKAVTEFVEKRARFHYLECFYQTRPSKNTSYIEYPHIHHVHTVHRQTWNYTKPQSCFLTALKTLNNNHFKFTKRKKEEKQNMR